ncbi:MAG: hypothetical protein WCC63_07890, partial [Candidatus Bathyarchaeia archaeon]
MRFPRLLRDFDRINWTIIAAVLGIASGIVLEVRSDVETTTAITAGVAVSIAVMQLGELAQRDRTAEILGTFYRVRRDRDLHRYVDEFVEYYTDVEALRDKEFMQETRRTVQAALDDLSLLAEGRLRIEMHEEMSLAIDALQRCNEKLHACSWHDLVAYWNTPEGKCYVDETEKLVRKGVQACRVFILRRDELEEYKEILTSQAHRGIEVRVAVEEDIPTECLEAYVVYDDSAVRIETLVRGHQKTAVLSVDKNDVERYQRKFT